MQGARAEAEGQREARQGQVTYNRPGTRGLLLLRSPLYFLRVRAAVEREIALCKAKSPPKTEGHAEAVSRKPAGFEPVPDLTSSAQWRTFSL